MIWKRARVYLRFENSDVVLKIYYVKVKDNVAFFLSAMLKTAFSNGKESEKLFGLKKVMIRRYIVSM